jgi:hypothetical protein
MYGQFMSGAGRGLGKDSFGAGLGAQQTYGVGLETSGAMMHSFRRLQSSRYASGVGTEADGLAQFRKQLSAAVTLGLDGAELTGYMQESASLLSQQVELGQRDIDMTAFREQERDLGRELGGFQGARITRGFAQGVSEMGYSGAGGATEFQLASAAGYAPGQGMDSYFEALQKMQDVGQNPALMDRYLERYTDPDIGGEHTRIAMVQRAMEAVGVRMHADTARRYLGGDKGALSEVTAGVGVSGVSSDLVTEASFERRRADMGGTMASAMQSLTETTLEMTRAAAAMSGAMTLVADGMAGIAGLAADGAEIVGPLIDKLIDVIDNGFF